MKIVHLAQIVLHRLPVVLYLTLQKSNKRKCLIKLSFPIAASKSTKGHVACSKIICSTKHQAISLSTKHAVKVCAPAAPWGHDVWVCPPATLEVFCVEALHQTGGLKQKSCLHCWLNS